MGDHPKRAVHEPPLQNHFRPVIIPAKTGIQGIVIVPYRQ